MAQAIDAINARLDPVREWLQTPVQSRALHWLSTMEIGLICLWAIYVGRAYLDMNPTVWPAGREFGMAIQPHYVWTQFRTCGLCALWNGYNSGGYPAFVELHAAVLHPLVVISTFLLGGINGVKVVLIGSLAMAGLGQWWLARVLGLGRVARLWSAGMAVVGGHLAGRMEMGVVGVVVSTAACSLVVAPGLKLALSGRRRDAIVLSFVLALAIVSGQGYLQLGLLFGVLPAFALFFIGDQLNLRPVWKEFLLAGGLGLLLAAVFLVPLLHFWPQFGKHVDPTFSAAQPIQYVLLNLVISDVDFFYSETLGKQTYPYATINFIGWIPVLLSMLTLRLARRSEQRLLTFFWIAIGLVLLVSNASTFRFLIRFLPATAGIRTISLAAGLLVPLILGLAAWGLDRLLRLNWPVLILAPSETNQHPRLTIRLSWLLMFLALLTSLVNAYRFSQKWLLTVPQLPGTYQVVASVKTASTQWVALPYGEHFWGPIVAEAGLKQTGYVRPWLWRDRAQPPPAVEATRHDVAASGGEFLREVDSINLVRHPQQTYSFVILSEEAGQEPCRSVATGGNIDVYCQNDTPGTLFVHENNWSGWSVKRDGRPAEVGNESWLSTPAPAGEHHFLFRYRPWDAVIGFALSLVGLFVAGWLWFRSGEEKSGRETGPAPALPDQPPDA